MKTLHGLLIFPLVLSCKLYGVFSQYSDSNSEESWAFEYESNEVPDFKEGYDQQKLEQDHDVYKRYLFKRDAMNEFRQKALELHNIYRAKHGSPPLELDNQLNKEAQAYAEKLAKTNVNKHSCDPCEVYGENLAYNAQTRNIPKGAAAAEWACKKWYDEVSLYNFNNPNVGAYHNWGHFTALVWKQTTKMGIGIAYGTKLSKSGNPMETAYVVARYLPPGNVLTKEAMKQNVLPPRK